MVKVDSGIRLPLVNVLEPTLGSTEGEVIVNPGIGSHTKLPMFLLEHSLSSMEKL